MIAGTANARGSIFSEWTCADRPAMELTSDPGKWLEVDPF
jgi:hypothetical protein